MVLNLIHFWRYKRIRIFVCVYEKERLSWFWYEFNLFQSIKIKSSKDWNMNFEWFMFVYKEFMIKILPHVAHLSKYFNHLIHFTEKWYFFWSLCFFVYSQYNKNNKAEFSWKKVINIYLVFSSWLIKKILYGYLTRKRIYVSCLYWLRDACRPNCSQNVRKISTILKSFEQIWINVDWQIFLIIWEDHVKFI